MFIEGIDMDQVFRNVRREVMEITGQGTVNYDQLTGGSFYLVESTFEKEFALIDSLRRLPPINKILMKTPVKVG